MAQGGINLLDFGGDPVQDPNPRFPPNPDLIPDAGIWRKKFKQMRRLRPHARTIIRSVVLARWQYCSQRWFEISGRF